MRNAFAQARPTPPWRRTVAPSSLPPSAVIRFAASSDERRCHTTTVRPSSLPPLRHHHGPAVVTARRSFIVQLLGRERFEPTAQQLLGLEQPYDAMHVFRGRTLTASLLRRAFAREALRLSSGSESSSGPQISASSNPLRHGGATSSARLGESDVRYASLQEREDGGNALYRGVGAFRRDPPAAHGGPASVAARMQRLVEAYRVLARDDEAHRMRYTLHHASSTDRTLGLKRELSYASNPDPAHHQHFYFSDLAVKPLSDFTKIYHDVTGVPDIDAAMAEGEHKARYRLALTGLGPQANSQMRRAAKTLLRSPVKGSDVRFLLQLSFEEAVLGGTKTILLERATWCERCVGHGVQQKASSAVKCGVCSGRGEVQIPSSTYVMRKPCTHCAGIGWRPPAACQRCSGSGLVPSKAPFACHVEAGVGSGCLLRLKGMGNFGARRGAAGDLVVQIVVAEHRYYHRDGFDVHVVVPVKIGTAILGGEVDVPLIGSGAARAEGNATGVAAVVDGGEGRRRPKGATKAHLRSRTAKILVPAGVTSGTALSVAGEGIRRPDGTYGSLIVRLVVVVPSAGGLTDKQIAALHTLSGTMRTAQREGDHQEDGEASTTAHNDQQEETRGSPSGPTATWADFEAARREFGSLLPSRGT